MSGRRLLGWLLSATLLTVGWATVVGSAPPFARAAGTTLYVTTSGSDTTNCQAIATPCATIGYAISQANPAGGDSIHIGYGAYTQGTTGASTGDIIIDRGLTLQADATLPPATGATTVTIDGNNAQANRGRTITVNAGVTAVIAGITITGGNIGGGDTGGSGGGILNLGTLTLTNSTVTANSAAINGIGTLGGDPGNGGGIDNQGTLTLTNSAVTNNTTNGNGGGIANEPNATLSATGSTINANTSANNPDGSTQGGGINNIGTATLTNSTVNGNTADFGAGINNGDGFSFIAGTLTLINSSVSGNNAPNGSGAGIINGPGTITLTGSTVSGNSAGGVGGGIFNTDTATLTNSTVSGNSAASASGGIDNEFGTAFTLINSTVSGNSVPSDGCCAAGIFNGSPLTLANTLVVGNLLGGTEDDLDDCGCGSTTDNGGNMIGLTLGTTTYTLGQVVKTDTNGNPLLANNGGPTQTIALAPGSPAVGLGVVATCAASPVNGVDQRGYPRGTTTCDTGAFELSGTQPPTSTSVSVTSPSGNPLLGQPVTLNAVVSDTGYSDPSGFTPTGTVTFHDGSATGTVIACAEGDPSTHAVPLPGTTAPESVTCTTSSLSGGAHTITAVYSGDSTFAGSQGSTTLTVARPATSTTLTASTGSGPVDIGQPVTYTAIVAPSTPGAYASPPSGTLTFTDNGVMLCNQVSLSTVGGKQQATCTTSYPASAVGTHGIVATYSGDTNFSGSAVGLSERVEGCRVLGTLAAGNQHLGIAAGSQAGFSLHYLTYLGGAGSFVVNAPAIVSCTTPGMSNASATISGTVSGKGTGDFHDGDHLTLTVTLAGGAIGGATITDTTTGKSYMIQTQYWGNSRLSITVPAA